MPAGRYALLPVIEVRNRHVQPKPSQKVFEPFFTTKPIGRGAGLRLATVLQGIQSGAAASSGWTASRVQGTVFTVCFPEMGVSLWPPAPSVPRSEGSNPDAARSWWWKTTTRCGR